MKKIDVGQTITLLANVGVIAGIVFLAIELGQNKDLMRAQIRHELSQGAIDTIVRESADLETVNLFRRGLEGGELTPDEQIRFNQTLSAWFRYMEDVHFQYRNGLYEHSEFANQVNVWKGRLQMPSVHDHWCATNKNFAAEFVESVNSLAAVNC